LWHCRAIDTWFFGGGRCILRAFQFVALINHFHELFFSYGVGRPSDPRAHSSAELLDAVAVDVLVPWLVAQRSGLRSSWDNTDVGINDRV